MSPGALLSMDEEYAPCRGAARLLLFYAIREAGLSINGQPRARLAVKFSAKATVIALRVFFSLSLSRIYIHTQDSYSWLMDLFCSSVLSSQ